MSQVVHPVFLEFIQHVNDEYWKLLYEDMAFGKFPPGVYIQKGHFCCYHKGKEFSIKLENNFNVFTHIHSLLKTNMGISSEKEKIRLKEESLQMQELRDKRLIKDTTLTSYVIREGNKHRLPDTIIRRIFSLLIIGFMFKTILIKDVAFDGNQIKSIKGFSFSHKKVRINKSILDVKNTTVDHDHKPDAVCLSSYWPKYINHISSFSSSSI